MPGQGSPNNCPWVSRSSLCLPPLSHLGTGLSPLSLAPTLEPGQACRGRGPGPGGLNSGMASHGGSSRARHGTDLWVGQPLGAQVLLGSRWEGVQELLVSSQGGVVEAGVCEGRAWPVLCTLPAQLRSHQSLTRARSSGHRQGWAGGHAQVCLGKAWSCGPGTPWPPGETNRAIWEGLGLGRIR